MTWERDPIDRYYRERLAGSTLASLILHALFALLFFSVLASSSQEGATEKAAGGETVTIERRAPISVANVPAAVAQTPPVPHVPRIAPIRHAPIVQPQTQRLPQNLHELAREVPSAPPNPRPIPQQSPQPNPQPTQNVYEVQPSNEVPAAPANVATIAPLAVSIKPLATAVPSPAPTAAPSLRPSSKPPAPTALPSAKVASPAPARPSASPTAAAIAIRASAAPSLSPAPALRASAPPAPNPGIPSPGPTNGPTITKTAGTAPSPGPKGLGSPGPRPGTAAQTKAAPPRPIELRPTPKPPSATRPASSPKATNLNAKLRALLPNNPVNPTSKQYVPQFSLRGRMEPTPPPEVLAATKYIYRSERGSEGRVIMWVTQLRKAGPLTVCTGWLVRYPLAAAPPAPLQHPSDIPPANGTQITVGGGRGAPGLMPPIVDGIVTQACEARLLVPFAGSAASSP
ncbi:MAG: hypothetical protein JO302_02620 [Candidatus Eremiobacteraeota bacterium]|nr:hypothetical protein [Candidatus Eremiobacteraeota bacterium]